MATTSPDNIWTPDNSDEYDLTVDLAAMATSVQTALEKRANSYKGTSAQRVAFQSSVRVGDLWQDTNGTQDLYVWTGTWNKIPRKVVQLGSQRVGSDLVNIGIPASPTADSDVQIRTGFWHGFTSWHTTFLNEYVPAINFSPSFPNACLSVLVQPIHSGAADARSANGVAVDIKSNSGFRAMYPRMSSGGAATERAFFWVAFGY